MNPWEGIAAAMSGTPRLTSPACRGLTWLADLDHASDGDDIETAKSVCRACPALPACADWVDGLSRRQKPAGVVAGRLMGRNRALNHERKARQ